MVTLTREAERALVLGARQGDDGAFAALVKAHQQRIYSLALRMLGSAPDAEDVLQETFLALHRSLGRFRGGSRLSTYLYRTAMNFSLLRLRQRSRRRERPVPLDEAIEEPQTGPTPLERVVADELRGRLGSMLRELPENDRAAVVLRDLEGLSGGEAAAVLGIGQAALKSRLHRGREQLRLKLAPYLNERSPSAMNRSPDGHGHNPG
jgi:RNA polymerase sigma-70 factor (ECF subfamily)